MDLIGTTCKNRNALLPESVKSWLAIPAAPRILVVDWSSDTPVSETLAGLDVDIVRVEGEQYFHASKAGNRLLSEALGMGADFIFMPDCDITVLPPKAIADKPPTPPFFSLERSENVFYRGGTAKLAGTFFLSVKKALEVGGYDESVQGYGKECPGFFQRLLAAGMEQRFFPANFLKHQDHEGRMDNYPAAGG